MHSAGAADGAPAPRMRIVGCDRSPECSSLADYGRRFAYAGGVPLDWSSGALAEGLACYRRTEFFEAHEHWESVWLQLEEPEKSFLQALIQTTAALHHLRAGNRVRRGFTVAAEPCAGWKRRPACFGGIDAETLRAEIRAWLQALENAGGRRAGACAADSAGRRGK